mmetsp:Transcript_47571/g.119767  ORF Transcript_47571/g.119767 Transcript_47571/m.119767 type:complete len:273 (+) Transcript_47571:1700-2518(+)
MLPADTNDDQPNPSPALQSRMAVPSAPLWLSMATLPSGVMTGLNDALRLMRGVMMPRQLGPTMRTLCLAAMSVICLIRAAPSGPISPKPAVMMMAPGTPSSHTSCITSGTLRAGMVITTRSNFSGMSFRLGQASCPRTVLRLLFTGKIFPAKGEAVRFSRMERPTLPSRSLAPTSATLRGSNILRSCAKLLSAATLVAVRTLCGVPASPCHSPWGRARLRSEAGGQGRRACRNPPPAMRATRQLEARRVSIVVVLRVSGFVWWWWHRRGGVA